MEKKNIRKFALVFFAAMILFSSYAGYAYPATFIGDFSFGIATSSVASLLFLIITDINELSATSLRIYLISKLYSSRKVRVSMASLFRIYVNEKYLLIENLKHGTITPIGGVIKYYSGATNILEKIGATSQIEADTESHPKKYKSELRLKFSMRYFYTFLDWFYSGQHREYDPLRELDEELFEPNSINKNEFGKITYSKYGTFRLFSAFDSANDYYLCHHFDIFTLHLSEAQIEIIKSAVEKSQNTQNMGEKLYWATSDEILRERLINGRKMGGNVKYVHVPPNSDWEST